MRVLLLGGTAEARALAARLVGLGHDVTSSLAGRVREPQLPVGAVRVGGFGGVDGLRSAAADFDTVVDATHPFAERISANAAAACADLPRVPLVRLLRPGWEPRPGWHLVDGHDRAAADAARLGRRPLLTVGRQPLGRYAGPLRDHAVLARVVDQPDIDLPAGWEVVLDRGPYPLDGELALQGRHGADVLVTKDSGGSLTIAKLDAAARRGIPVVVVRRPAPPPGVPVLHDVEAAVRWVDGLQVRS
ncbi:MAG: cobalt-precorrin-6A reductase [Dermatophilaceae bacterium]